MRPFCSPTVRRWPLPSPSFPICRPRSFLAYGRTRTTRSACGRTTRLGIRHGAREIAPPVVAGLYQDSQRLWFAARSECEQRCRRRFWTSRALFSPRRAAPRMRSRCAGNGSFCAHVSGLSDWFTGAGFQDAMGAHERADYGYTRGVPREVWAGFEGSAQQVYVRPIPVAHPDGGGQASCGVWAAVRPNRWRLQAIQNPDAYAGKPPPHTHRHSVAATSHNRHALAS